MGLEVATDWSIGAEGGRELRGLERLRLATNRVWGWSCLGMCSGSGVEYKMRVGVGVRAGDVFGSGVEDGRELRLATWAGFGVQVGGEVRVGCRGGVGSIPGLQATHGAPFSPCRQQPGRPLRLMQ